MREWVREASVYEWEIAMMFWEVCERSEGMREESDGRESMRRRKGKGLVMR